MKKIINMMCLFFVFAIQAAIFAVPNQEIVHLTSSNAVSTIDSNEYVVVDVYTDWCGPCKLLGPIYQELHQEYGHLYTFAKLNADQQRGLSQAYKVTGLPTILFIKNGAVIGTEVGYMSKDKFKSRMVKYFGN